MTMKKSTNYSENIKHTALEKILGSSGMSIPDVSKEMGINKRTLYGWVYQSNNGDMTRKKKRKYNRRKVSFQDKYKTVLEYLRLSDNEKGKWLRENGFHEDQLKLWEHEIESTLNLIDTKPSDKINKEMQSLKKELARKDKALAEVSALLVLKKKWEMFLESREEDSEK